MAFDFAERFDGRFRTTVTPDVRAALTEIATIAVDIARPQAPFRSVHPLVRLGRRSAWLGSAWLGLARPTTRSRTPRHAVRTRANDHLRSHTLVNVGPRKSWSAV